MRQQTCEDSGDGVGDGPVSVLYCEAVSVVVTEKQSTPLPCYNTVKQSTPSPFNNTEKQSTLSPCNNTEKQSTPSPCYNTR